MSITGKIKNLLAAAVILCSGSAYAGNAVIASGEASEDMAESVIHLASASANLSGASLNLSGEVAIALGRPLADVVVRSAEISSDALIFSAASLSAGILTTAHLSSQLTSAGIQFSADSATLSADAAQAGIYLSVDTAEFFLDQAVSVAAASGRLSGEVAELTVALSAAGVELSADSVRLIANAGNAGIHLSGEMADAIISASLAVASECIEKAVFVERYVLMTLKDANRLVKEASIATVQMGLNGGKKSYQFTVETATHLHSLGLDATKFAKELSKRAMQRTTTGVTHIINGTNDTIVIVINTGSGLLVASLDTLTEAVEKSTSNLNK